MSNVELFDTNYTNMDKLIELSQSLNEPKWLLERRKNAYHTYQELPYDKDHLFYKYTTFKDFNPKSLTHNWKYNGEGNHELLKTYEQNLKPFMVETTNSLQSSLPEDLQKIGVFFDTLHNLIKIDEVKAKKIISMVDKSTSKFDKLGSLSRAFAVNIIVLYVPKNVIITEIIGKITQINNSTTANFGEFIAIFEDGSQATYYNIYNDNSSDNNAKLYSIIETVIVGDNARVKSFQLQDFNPSAVFLLSKYSEINRYGVYRNLSHLQGGHLSRQNSFIDLIGDNAEGYDLFTMFGQNKQRFDVKSELKHTAKSTIGQTHARQVMMDKSEAVLRGLIVIPESGYDADSWLTTAGMTVGQGKVNSIPALQIDQNEVAAAHAASVEPLNEELVFYLKARGVNEKEAREMLIKGYFEYVFKLFNDINSIEILRDSLNLKWDLSL